ncbi:MAG: PTS transporter subunit EIIA [Erysipelotrichaceae bacterium]|nr:PTS transporter subunit EIIA [Erysipelotrichaceae bacterium]
MKDKEHALLDFLGCQEGWTTAFKCASTLGFSVRSIKNYTNNINADYPDLIESSRLGYQIIDKIKLSMILKSFKNDFIPQTVEERKKVILKKLLLEEENYDLDTLASELFISPVTLNNELSKIKLDLVDFDLIFRTKNNFAFIEGLEKNKKKMISRLIYEESKENFISMDLIQEYLPHFDLKIVKKIVSDVLLNKHYFLDDFSLLNLILHIAITMERSLSNENTKESIEVKNKIDIDSNIISIIDDILLEIYTQFNIKFTQVETYDLALLIMTRVLSDYVDQLTIDHLSEVVGSSIVDLVSQIQQRTQDVFNLSLKSHDFTIRFSLHIRNMLIRLENKIILRNPQMIQIKNTYPFIYDVSVFISNIVTQKSGYVLSEDEIAYIALHIGVLIEEKKAMKTKLKVLFLCPQYFFSKPNIVNKCTGIFGDSILVSGMIASQDEIENNIDYDLLISTIPLNLFPDKPFIIVSNYFSNKDISNISHKIDETLKARSRKKMQSKLEILFKEDFFFVNPSFKNEKDTIEVLSNKLHQYGVVDQDFKRKLFEREAISSSAYINIAMPHPLEMCAKKSTIAVSIHPEGILWHNSKVNIIFMLAIHEEDRLFFKDLFDFITEIISEEKQLKAILEVKSFDEFITLFASYAK